MIPKMMVRVTLIISHLISKQVDNLLTELKIPLAFWQYARRDLLNFNTLSAKIIGRPTAEPEPMDIFVLYLPPSSEQAFYQRVIYDLDLTLPGRGSIYSQIVKCYFTDDISFEPIQFEDHGAERLLSTKTHGITLITGRGQADEIAYRLMEEGYIPPNITFGRGVGSRDKLGLIRITIPQEKEILHLTAYYQDVPIVLNILHQVARLDLPGKGFVYHYPINYAKIDTKTHAHLAFHMASTDQIIAAIDTLMNSIDWRKKSYGHLPSEYQENISTHSDIVCLNVYIPYGSEDNTTEAAFKFGVSGATLTRHRSLRYKEGDITRDRDFNVYTLVMNQKTVDPVLSHLRTDTEYKNILVDSYHIMIG